MARLRFELDAKAARGRTAKVAASVRDGRDGLEVELRLRTGGEREPYLILNADQAEKALAVLGRAVQGMKALG